MESQRKRLMDAFQCDCQTLLTRFELTYNTHFQNFCEIWREMKFSLIFDCQPTDITLNIFHKDALRVTKQFLINAPGLKERIGALYLMYSIYYMVPANKARIRMTISDWKCLMNLHQLVKVEEYLDANYILCKLIVDCAFIHCFSDSEYNIEKQFQKNKVKSRLGYNLLPEIKKLAATGKMLSTIKDMSKIYEEKKRDMFSKESMSSVQLFDTNMADDIIKSIHAIQYENVISNHEPGPSTSDSVSAVTLASTSVPVPVPIPVPVSTSMPTSASTSSAVPVIASNNHSSLTNKKRRLRLRKRLILAKIGGAFKTAIKSESEEEMETESESDIDGDVTDPLEGV